MQNTYPSLVNGTHNFPPWRYHCWVLAFSEDLSSLGPCWKPRRQKGESTYKPLGRCVGEDRVFTPFPSIPKAIYIWILYLWKQTSIYTTQIYHAPALGRHPTSPSCSLKENLLAATCGGSEIWSYRSHIPYTCSTLKPKSWRNQWIYPQLAYSKNRWLQSSRFSLLA